MRSTNKKGEMFVENVKIKKKNLEADPNFRSKVSFSRINLIDCQRSLSGKVSIEKKT